MTNKSQFVDALDQQSQTETPEAPIVSVPKLSTWLYVQQSGELFQPDGSFCGRGYSGNGDGFNNPSFQDVANVGPIPCGIYKLGEISEEKGPITIRLEPAEGNQMYGRSGFLVHGDNPEQNYTASHGCIIMPRFARIELSRGGSIRVIAKQAQTET